MVFLFEMFSSLSFIFILYFIVKKSGNIIAPPPSLFHWPVFSFASRFASSVTCQYVQLLVCTIYHIIIILFSLCLALTRSTYCTLELKEALLEGHSQKQAVSKFEKHKKRYIITISVEHFKKVVKEFILGKTCNFIKKIVFFRNIFQFFFLFFRSTFFKEYFPLATLF